MDKKKNRLALGSLSLALLAGTLTTAAGAPSAGTLLDSLKANAAAQAPESEPNSPGSDWLMDQRVGQNGTVTSNQYRRALRQSRQVARLTAIEAPGYADAEWDFMGPTNIGGRVTDVVVDPLAADTAYAATATGGVRKSTDAGATWAVSWPSDITQSLGALAIGSDGVLYAGTGESNPGGGSITYGGTGIYRSTDHGATWQFSGLPQSGAFGRIMVDPTDPKRVYAAAAGDLYREGFQRGLYLSEDGGDTWERILAPQNLTTGAVDLAIDPQNPNNLLVTMWDHQRLPSHRMYGGEGSGVWRSTDRGETWTEVVLPHGLEDWDVGRIGVAFAPSNPNRAYAIVASKLSGHGVGFFRSDDGGASFTKTAATVSSLSQSSFGWWFGRIWVDPDTPNTVFVPGVSLVRSTNGGDSFSGVSGPHADQHGMAWDPKVANRVYLGNDGGMYRSDNDGTTWTAATYQGWTQSYTVDVGELTPNMMITGLQDNGCILNRTADTAPDQWQSVGLCGDGLETLINPTHQALTYACSQYGSCGIAPGGAPAGAPMSMTSDRRGWLTPIIFDPTTSSTMYWGGNRLNRSINSGASWTAISPDLTKNEEQLDPNSGYHIRNVISAIGASKSDPETVWVGTDDGLLQKTSNASASSPTWTLIEHNALPDAWVTRVTIDPVNKNNVYATYSGYRGGDDSARVLRSTDGGATWQDISGNLPEAPVNDLVVVGNRLVTATDVGVFISTGDHTWYRLGGNLPTVPVTELRYHAGTNTITAATFGHGIQRIVIPSA